LLLERVAAGDLPAVLVDLIPARDLRELRREQQPDSVPRPTIVEHLDVES